MKRRFQAKHFKHTDIIDLELKMKTKQVVTLCGFETLVEVMYYTCGYFAIRRFLCGSMVHKAQTPDVF